MFFCSPFILSLLSLNIPIHEPNMFLSLFCFYFLHLSPYIRLPYAVCFVCFKMFLSSCHQYQQNQQINKPKKETEQNDKRKQLTKKLSREYLYAVWTVSWLCHETSLSPFCSHEIKILTGIRDFYICYFGYLFLKL